MINIVEKKEKWDSLLLQVDDYDFYHTYDYHFISKKNSEKPILLHYRENDVIILLPLLVRSITNTPFFDATSCYGYLGPISKNITECFDNSNFISEVNQYFIRNNIITVFSRLNPYIAHQGLILKGLGETPILGNVVNVDITKSLEVQKNKIQKRNRTYINKARRNCITKNVQTVSELEIFHDIYLETMNRLDADALYHFDHSYFHSLTKSNVFKTEILLAIDNENNEVMAGAMFVKTNGIVQYHLSGTRDKYLSQAPTKLLIDEMRIKSTLEGYKYFNLGGGYKGFQDSLFGFKSTFSDDILDFKVWKYVVNENIYSLQNNSFCLNCSNYFPSYRCPHNINVALYER